MAGRTVGIAGVGKVGHLLAEHALRDGARVVVTDVNPDAVRRLQAAFPEIEAVDSTDELVRRELDVYAPCALGHALTDEVVDVLQAALICGGANNQLAHDGIAERLAERTCSTCPTSWSTPAA